MYQLRPDLVPRRQLLARLDESLSQCRLTLLAAPAGFGKTTLLRSWLMGVQRSHAWISLDDAQNDPAIFFACLATALQQIVPALGRDVQRALQGTTIVPVDALAASLLHDLAGAPVPSVLLLDDYHAMTNPGIHELVQLLLDGLPPHCHLVVATRADPPLALARLRARGQLCELRAHELRFTHDETVAFLSLSSTPALDPHSIELLYSRTEGWPAALRLAALSLHSQHDPAGFVRGFSGSHRHIADYLLDEVLACQPPALLSFLLQTCLLERLSASLCDAVVEGEGASQLVLDELERSGLFLMPLDEQRRWYRYHQLFADLLRDRLAQQMPERIPALHRRASRWLADHDMPDSALTHALAAGDPTWPAALVEGSARTMLMDGQVAQLARWISLLPVELARTRPRLCLAAFMAHYGLNDLAGAEDWLRAVEQWLAGRPDGGDDELRGEFLAYEALRMAARGDFPGAIALTQRAEACSAADDAYLRGTLRTIQGAAYHANGEVEQAVGALTEASVIGVQIGHQLMALLSRLRLAEIYVSQGALHRAYETYQQAVRGATDGQGQPLPLAAPAIAGLGNVLFEWGDDRAALEQLEQALVFGTLLGIDAVRVECYLTIARIRQAQSDGVRAHEALDQAEQIARPWNSPATSARISAQRTRLWLSQGDVAGASRWASAYDSDSRAVAQGTIETLTLLRVRIAQAALDRDEGQLQQTDALLAQLLGSAEERGQRAFVIELYVQQGRLLNLRGESERALVALEHAVRLAADEQVCRPFIEEGPQLYALLAALARQPLSARLRTFMQHLSSSLPYEGPADKNPVAGPRPEALLGEPLTERERAVLRLVIAGLQDKEIAQALVVSLNTIRYHTKNIYRKLQVRSRSQAIAQAARLEVG